MKTMTDKKKTKTTSDLEKLDSLLVDTPEEGVPYIKANNIETKLSKEKRDEVHEIVREIKQFGISQRQMTYLIYQLGLNLENRQAMLAVTQAVNSTRDFVPVESKIVVDTEVMTRNGKKKILLG
jgi:hypothetical protein